MGTPDSEFVRVAGHEAGHAGFPHEHMRCDIVSRIDPEKAYEYFRRTQGWDRRRSTSRCSRRSTNSSSWGTLGTTPPRCQACCPDRSRGTVAPIPAGDQRDRLRQPGLPEPGKGTGAVPGKRRRAATIGPSRRRPRRRTSAAPPTWTGSTPRGWRLDGPPPRADEVADTGSSAPMARLIEAQHGALLSPLPLAAGDVLPLSATGAHLLVRRRRPRAARSVPVERLRRRRPHPLARRPAQHLLLRALRPGTAAVEIVGGDPWQGGTRTRVEVVVGAEGSRGRRGRGGRQTGRVLREVLKRVRRLIPREIR